MGKSSLRLILVCVNVFGVVSLRAEIITVNFGGSIQTGTGPINGGDPYTLKLQYDTGASPILSYPPYNYRYPLVNTYFTTPNYFGSTQSGALTVQNGNGNLGTVGGQDQFDLDGYASGAFPQIVTGYVFKDLVLQLQDWNGSMFDSAQPPTQIRTDAWNPYFFGRLTWFQGSNYHYVDLNIPSSIEVIPEPGTGSLVLGSFALLFFTRRRANRRC